MLDLYIKELGEAIKIESYAHVDDKSVVRFCDAYGLDQAACESIDDMREFGNTALHRGRLHDAALLETGGLLDAW